MLKKISKKISALMFVGVVLSSCTTLTKQNADWNYTKDAINLNVTASGELNNYDSEPHILSMAVVQVSSTSKYSNLLQTSSGVSSALANVANFEEQTGFDRFYIKPGEKKEISVARQKGTEYVFLVFGYANAKPEENSKMIPIPFDGGWSLWSDGPLVMNVSVDLGSNGIENIQNSEEDNGLF